jgi:hypothetical protein
MVYLRFTYFCTCIVNGVVLLAEDDEGEPLLLLAATILVETDRLIGITTSTCEEEARLLGVLFDEEEIDELDVFLVKEVLAGLSGLLLPSPLPPIPRRCLK